jgi:hypothetical protein
MFETGNIVLVDENVRKARHKYLGKTGVVILRKEPVGKEKQPKYLVAIGEEGDDNAIFLLEDELTLLA